MTPIYCYHHTHWDREWYAPFRAYQVRLAEVVDEVLQQLKAGELWYFTLDGQTSLLEDYLALRPENEKRLKALIKDGKISIGPWYVMPDEFLVSGESLIRNLQKGIRQSKAFGCTRFTGYLPDTFGHSSDIPTVLTLMGIDSAMVWRGVHPSGKCFQWESRNGDKVATYHLADGYFQNMLHDPNLALQERKVALRTWLDKAQKSYHSLPILLPLGGDHLGPTPFGNVPALSSVFDDIEETTPARFMDLLTSHELPTVQGHLLDNTSTFVLPGVWSARTYLKQANRQLEHRLTKVTEPMSSMATAFAKAAYPKHELDAAWTLLIQNHPHDSICGCSTDEVHRENETRFDQVQSLCDALLARQRTTLANSVNASEDQWVLINTGDTPYSGVVPVREWTTENAPTAITQVNAEKTILQDAYRHDFNQVPLSHLTMTERTGWIWGNNIPPFGIKVVPKSRKADFCWVLTDEEEGRIENEFLIVQMGRDGSLSILDKRAGKAYTGIHRLVQQPDQGDSYNSAPVPGSSETASSLIEWKCLQSGPLAGVFKLSFKFDHLDLPIETTLSVFAGSSQVSFETVFTNNTENHQIQAVFNTGKAVKTVEAESHFGVDTWTFDPDFSVEAHMPAGTGKEIMPNTLPVQRFLIANDQLFITEGLSEAEASGSQIKITLLRAFGYLSKPDTGVRGAPAGPPFETPQGQCLGRTFRCRYAWAPSGTGEDRIANAYREADRFYGIVSGEQGLIKAAAPNPETSTESFLVCWDNPAVIASACYQAENGLVLRLINTSAKSQDIKLRPSLPVKQYRLADGLETPGESFPIEEPLSLKLFDVRTVLF